MNTAAVKIREMKPDDTRQIIELDKRIMGKERVLSWPQKVGRYLEMYYPPLCHVAEVEGKIVGFILGDVRGWEYALLPAGWVDIMGVDPAYQGKEVGRKLLDAFVQACQRRNMKTHVIVRKGDERVKGLLIAAGFTEGQLVDYEK